MTRAIGTALFCAAAILLQAGGTQAGGGGSCSPISNACDPTFDTGNQDCSGAYPDVGTPPLTTGKAGYANFGGPQVSPMLQLRHGKGSPYRRHIFVLNTLNNEVSVLDWRSLERVASVKVGLDPSAIAQTKDGRRILVSNWASDTISVIDTANLRIIETIEHRDADGRPLLSEPMGIAIRKNEKAYVASSATNQIAVIDLDTLSVTDMITVPTRDPRAIQLDRRGRFLAVTGLASGNKTEIDYDPLDPSVTGIGEDPESGLSQNCSGLTQGKPELFDPADPGYMNPADPDFRDAFNCLVAGRINAFGAVVEPLVINPRIPDHDLVIIDTKTDEIVSTSDGLGQDPGTLNYGVAFSRSGKKIMMTNTHARNEVDFEDRPFLNRVSVFDVDRKTGALSLSTIADVDVDPGQSKPTIQARAATPYAVIPTKNRQWVVTAAGSDRIMLVDDQGAVQTRLEVGFLPRGLVRESARKVHVFNAASFTVQRWDVAKGELLAEGSIGDNPMPMEERHGMHLFNGDQFSVERGFSCASCHPDGDTDQLAWLLDCEDGIRATMTLRQIQNTLPFHWSGDKCNGKKIMEDGVSNLFGKGGPPSACDTDLTWQFIESLRQPPPLNRPSDDVLSPNAELGLLITNRATYKGALDVPVPCNGNDFDPIVWPRLLQMMGDPNGDVVTFNRAFLTIQGASERFSVGVDSESCGVGACHASPFSGRGTLEGVEIAGFCANPIEPIEAVTFLGTHDRLLTEDDGRGGLHDFLVALDRYRQDVGATATGTALDEFGVARFGSGNKGFLSTFFRHPELEYSVPGQQGFVLTDAVEQFTQEQATGPSAVVGRQVTMTEVEPQTPLATFLVMAADDEKTNLLATGAAAGTTVDLLYNPDTGFFEGTGVPGGAISLTALAASLGESDAVTLTAGLPLAPGGAPFDTARDAQPFLFSITRDSGFPVPCSESYAAQVADFTDDETGVELSIIAVNFDGGVGRVFVNGEPIGGSPVLTSQFIYTWTLPAVPAGADTLVFQLQNDHGLMSNELAAPVIPPGAGGPPPALTGLPAIRGDRDAS